ncbi:probable serine incorporator [Hydra vulgaris]|uniref:Probable serine incorporator n=1 Tax=Hydra vulgaris TaxID=6087 RepID=A0ABM4CN97_HYDVU
MGAVLGTASCAASIACCCGSAACSLCCSACPSCKNSTSTRIVYSIFLLFTTIISCIMLVPKVEDQLQKINWLCEKAAKADCRELVGYIAVYRVSFGAVMFFLLLTVIMFGVKSSKDPRSGIQNGFWAIKFLVLIGIIVGAFFIPSKDGKFIQAWMYIGLIGAFLFILLQLVLLVDFAHSWNGAWVEKMEESDSKFWFFALVSSTFLMYAVSLAGIICMFIFFTNSPTSKCGTEKFVVSFQLVMSCVISFIALTPAVQNRQPQSGLLQAAAISLYTTYLAWSALSYSTTCNKLIAVSKTDFEPDVDAQSVIGVVITFFLVIFNCVRTSSSSQIGKLGLKYGSSEEKNVLDIPEDANSSRSMGDKNKGQHVYDDEDSVVAYSYSFFHLMMMLATLYLMMTITNWYKPSVSNLNKLSNSDAAFWVKISSSWVCFGIYLWTLCAPVIFPDRDFS